MRPGSRELREGTMLADCLELISSVVAETFRLKKRRRMGTAHLKCAKRILLIQFKKKPNLLSN